uniref:Uncharacterized protein n=1 Tax=Coptotermes formosanus TaxID=36987 RepID=R4ULB3_COPFO|nr:hypothetical protein [Coptotermes formosanus]
MATERATTRHRPTKSKPFQDHRATMDSNVLLVHHPLGHGAQSTRSLPPEDYRYGIVHHDRFGVRETFQYYATLKDVEKPQPDNSRIRAMTHGRAVPWTSEMKDCLEWQSGHAAVERAATRQARLTAKRAKVGRMTLASHGIPYTKAARCHTKKPAEPPTLVETFKMKRFTDISGYAIDDKP